MSKKEVLKNTSTIEEDLEIKKVANTKNMFQPFLLALLIILFLGMLTCSFLLVHNFYQKRDNASSEVIEIKNDKNKILIVNNGNIKENLSLSSFNNEETLKIEKVNSVNINTSSDAKTNGLVKYNVKYIINKNDFPKMGNDTTDSEILVRFAYSYDLEEWTYINNVISTTTSTIMPLMGKNYDISGINSTLSVISGEELESKPGENKTIHWKSETIIRNFKNENIVRNIEADFKIEYCTND